MHRIGPSVSTAARIALATAGLTFVALGAACSSSDPGHPVGEIRLTSASGTATRVIADNGTLAFGVKELTPPSSDPDGVTHSLYFNFSSSVPVVPQQEVLVLDTDLAQPVMAPTPDDFFPVPDMSYVSVPAEGIETFVFPGPGTSSHALRYWHGRCASSQAWDGFFEEISDNLFFEIMYGSVMQGAGTRLSRDEFQPMLYGYITDIRHGILFTADYIVDHPIAGEIPVQMNPAVTFEANSSGFVDVTTVHRGVVSGNATLEGKVDNALTNDLADGIASGIRNRITISLENPLLSLGCDANVSLPVQHRSCFDLLTRVDGGPSIADTLFRQALEAGGMDTPTAQTTAAQMVDGLVKENFTCEPASGGGAECAFHPVIQRVNVLPDVLEFVFVGEPEFSDPIEADKLVLYRNLPSVVNFFSPGDGDGLDFCDVSITRKDGVVPSFVHGPRSIGF